MSIHWTWIKWWRKKFERVLGKAITHKKKLFDSISSGLKLNLHKNFSLIRISYSLPRQCECEWLAAVEGEKHKTATVENPLNRVMVACPPLFPPTHGYLECTRPVESSNETGRLKIMNRPGSECRLQCPSRYE